MYKLLGKRRMKQWHAALLDLGLAAGCCPGWYDSGLAKRGVWWFTHQYSQVIMGFASLSGSIIRILSLGLIFRFSSRVDEFEDGGLEVVASHGSSLTWLLPVVVVGAT